jgi:hypothetical protein
MNATLKENIIFVSEYDEQKYESVVEAAGLRQDLAELPSGDQTEIGERGIVRSFDSHVHRTICYVVHALTRLCVSIAEFERRSKTKDLCVPGLQAFPAARPPHLPNYDS